MVKSHALHVLAILLAISVGTVGCSPEKTPVAANTAPEPTAPATPAATEAPKPEKKRVSDRPANTEGKVLVLEYHHISEKEARWDRSIDRFKADLERLYKMGFRPVTVSEYLSNKMDLPPGASPVVLTWDDANPSQFRLLDDGSVDPKSGVGIWKAFAEEHPDFPVKGTFYVLPTMWGQPKLVEKKVAMLKEWGSELGSHTISHPQLKKLSDEKVKEELGEAIDNLNELGFDQISIALPFGISPKDPEMLKSFEWKGKKYAMTGAMLVGANPAPAPTDPDFNPYRVPRIQSIEDDMGITYWLDKVESGDVEVYVAP
jgi:hypothetical protein